MRHARRKSKWSLYATTAAWFVGIALFAYWTINANPVAAGVAALAACAAIGVHIYLQDKRRP